MGEKSGPERKNRLAVVSKGLKQLSWDIYLIYFWQEIKTHPFYGTSHDVPESKQLKTMKNHGKCFPQPFGLWILIPCLVLQLSCIFMLQALRWSKTCCFRLFICAQHNTTQEYICFLIFLNFPLLNKSKTLEHIKTTVSDFLFKGISYLNG